MHEYARLDLWKRGIELSSRLHRAARQASSWADQSLWLQITRASTSIPANVAEGAQRGSDREFARFLGIATGSAAELHSLLVLAGESGMFTGPAADALVQEALALRRMASALRSRALGLRPRNQARSHPAD